MVLNSQSVLRNDVNSYNVEFEISFEPSFSFFFTGLGHGETMESINNKTKLRIMYSPSVASVPCAPRKAPWRFRRRSAAIGRSRSPPARFPLTSKLRYSPLLSPQLPRTHFRGHSSSHTDRMWGSPLTSTRSVPPDVGRQRTRPVIRSRWRQFREAGRRRHKASRCLSFASTNRTRSWPLTVTSMSCTVQPSGWYVRRRWYFNALLHLDEAGFEIESFTRG